MFCVSGQSKEAIIELARNVTAVLGEDVYLSCRFTNDSEIQSSKWYRQINSRVKTKGLAGFNNMGPYSVYDFSKPHSRKNLTVKMNVSSVEAEGQYTCEFETDKEVFSDDAFVTVVGKIRQYFTKENSPNL